MSPARGRRKPVRAVVIGAGHHGLVCAIRLASAGVDVTVLERADRPGGAVASSEDTLPGFVHDPGSGFFPLTVASPAFRELDLGVEWVNPPVAMAHPFLDGGAIVLHRELEATAASLEAVAPGAGRAWEAFIGPLLAHQDAFVGAVLSPLPAARPGLRLALGLRREWIELGRRLLSSVAGLGLELFGDARAAAWLCGSTAHSDLAPGSTGGAAFAVFLHLLGHLVGWPYPRGGAGRLAEALAGRLGELGGEIRCGAEVAEIELRDGRARGVDRKSVV